MIYQLCAIPIKMPEGIFVDINILILKFMWKSKGTWIPKTILKKKNKSGESILSDV